MAGRGESYLPVLVISDDEDLGGLIALSLRRRRLLVEQTDFCLAISPRWFPAIGRPAAAVVNIEKPSTNALSFLRVARRQSWLSGVPIVLAADDAAGLIAKLGAGAAMLPTRLDDVGAIVTAVLFLVAAASHDADSGAPDLRQTEKCEID